MRSASPKQRSSRGGSVEQEVMLTASSEPPAQLAAEGAELCHAWHSAAAHTVFDARFAGERSLGVSRPETCSVWHGKEVPSDDLDIECVGGEHERECGECS